MRRFNLRAIAVYLGFILSISCLLFLSTSFKTIKTGNKSGENEKFKVVIDAGHGGFDPGCQYGGVQEKNVTLAIALKLGKIIKKNCKDVKVIYTRDTDEFIKLKERTDIGNRAKANLFISIHCNAIPSKPSVAGTETYTLGLYKNQVNLSIAKKENEVILLEDDYKKNYDGYDPNSPESNIIFSLYQNVYVAQSLRFASMVETQVNLQAGRDNRGVKQAGFIVLWGTVMPSVLIETGYLSNASERKFLNSSEGQTQMANGIYDAFKKYKNEFEASN